MRPKWTSLQAAVVLSSLGSGALAFFAILRTVPIPLYAQVGTGLLIVFETGASQWALRTAVLRHVEVRLWPALKHLIGIALLTVPTALIVGEITGIAVFKIEIDKWIEARHPGIQHSLLASFRALSSLAREQSRIKWVRWVLDLLTATIFALPSLAAVLVRFTRINATEGIEVEP